MNNAIASALCAPDAPFEFGSATVTTHAGQQQFKVFKHAAPYLSAIYNNLDQFAERELAVYQNQRLGYKDALGQAASLAQYLQSEFSIQKGSRVAIIMRNCPQWLVSFIAVTSLGAIAALVNSRGSNDEINYAVDSSNCALSLVDHKTAKRLNDNAVLRNTHIIFNVDEPFSATDANGKTVALQENARLQKTVCKPDEVAVILYTSGTTGRPKGVLLSHRGLLNALKANEFSSALIGASIAAKMGVDLATLAKNQPPSATLLMFPLFHVSGCYSVFLANLIRGGKLVMMSRWDADTALDWIENEKITAFYGVPTMYWDLLQNDTLTERDLSSLSSVSVAGQATPKSLLEKINAAFPQAMIGAGYGMTETNGVICMTVGEDYLAKPDSVGQPLAIAEVKIVDEQNRECASGEAGEICIRGATVMLGYDKQPEANRKCFIDGWYRSGDVGYRDADGNLYIVDRLTEMIICGGENVYCAEVERVLSQVAGVIECTTFGVPDERLGERMIALARMTEGVQTTATTLGGKLAESLASYKVPAEIYIIDHELVRNATGKVLKNQAKDWYYSNLKKSP